jgi:hypothetical protein
MTIPIPAVGSTGWDVSVDAVINRVNELADIDPTSDADKPVSTATQAALDLKLDIASAYTDEQVRDVIASALVAGTDITITPDDTANTITIASTASGGGGPSSPVTLTDGATVALDASLGDYFRLAATASRTIGVPTNPTDGQAITIEHLASGGAWTLTLTTGSAGAFKFGTTITGLSQTTSGARDLIRAIYNSSMDRWLVVGYVKGL